jgi:hypothetical protein
VTTPKPTAGKRKLDPYTLRWVAREAHKGRSVLPMHSSEKLINEALEWVADKCTAKARAIESRDKGKVRK